jgi:hypothetical protein
LKQLIKVLQAVIVLIKELVIRQQAAVALAKQAAVLQVNLGQAVQAVTELHLQ